MTTVLDRSLTREVLLEGQPFKIVLSPSGLRISEKGRRKGTEVTWDTILALGETPTPPRQPASSGTDLPVAIAMDVAKDVRTATQALGRAATSLLNVAQIPPALLAEIEADHVHGRMEHRTDWYVEPLLTPDELASLLRISRSTASHLPIPSITIAGERRFRQSAVRRYLTDHETSPAFPR
jgi:hypothetical protein